MSARKEVFGTTKDGQEAHLYTLCDGGITAVVSDFGAVLVKLCVPDREGRMDDIVLGFDDLAGYERNPSCFGATVAPVANRIAGASFVIDGVEYHLPVNEGPNNLHSDKMSYRRLYDTALGENSVTFSLRMADGESGFPGNRDMAVTYTVTKDSLRIDYRITTDRETYLNPTNHTYFNLAGQGSGTIDAQILRLACSHYTPCGEGLIPTGEIRSVDGTPFDFRRPKAIAADLHTEDTSKNHPDLVVTGGYDHNFVIDGWKGDGQEILFAEVTDPASGRRMEVSTDMPGVQLYIAHGMYTEGCKGGRACGSRSGFCLETQCFPDTPHHDNFPSELYGPARPLVSATTFRFPGAE